MELNFHKPILIARCSQYYLIPDLISTLSKRAKDAFIFYLYTDLYIDHELQEEDKKQLTTVSQELELGELMKLIDGEVAEKTLSKDLERIFDEQIECDFQIIKDKKSIGCHKCILASRSKYFFKLFENDPNCTSLTDTSSRSYNTLFNFIKYFYSDSCDQIDTEIAKELLGTYNEYGLKSRNLEIFCMSLLEQNGIMFEMPKKLGEKEKEKN
ncbi:pep-cterm sorting domain-containing protein [Anaeramoeba flamelloides]|uniref:Pep-cterm sorting domain-containing protein n=1 Tax=Anaeramoeba flamelloides TaxID=1746091 RepID=A0ABQ8Y620_9EUKA|nr:pep-cterm sorting domain-containing protein [Anaeramoeba flamelloides]